MKRYLLFDSGCSLCTEVARRVEEAAGGWLEAWSLRDPEMRALLDRAKPGWKWEPTLVEVDRDEVRVYQGLGMRVRMVRGLGVRKSLAVAKEVQKASGLMVEVDWERRRLLKAMGGLVGAFVLLGINPKWAPLKVKTHRSRHPLEDVIVKETLTTRHFSAKPLSGGMSKRIWPIAGYQFEPTLWDQEGRKRAWCWAGAGRSPAPAQHHTFSPHPLGPEGPAKFLAAQWALQTVG